MLGAVCDEFVVTRVTFSVDNIVTDIACIGCPCYADSVLLLAGAQKEAQPASIRTRGWCMHTVACEEILELLPMNNDVAYSEPSSSFQRYVLLQIVNKDFVTLIGTHGRIEKYLVIADKALCFESQVPVYSICTVRTCGDKKYVHCKDVRCRKESFKAVHNVVDLTSVCCHLRTLISMLPSGIIEDENEASDGVGKHSCSETTVDVTLIKRLLLCIDTHAVYF